jgi:hypothetical protein
MRIVVAAVVAVMLVTGSAHADTIGTYAAEGPFIHDNLTLYGPSET